MTTTDTQTPKGTTEADSSAGVSCAAAAGSDWCCRLVGADMATDTIILELPPGIRPAGFRMGEFFTVQRVDSPNDQSHGTAGGGNQPQTH